MTLSVRMVAALLLTGPAADGAWAAAPPQPPWFKSSHETAAAGSYVLSPALVLPQAVAGDDVLVERWRSLPPPAAAPEHRDPFEPDPAVRSAVDDRIASTRSSREGCRAGSVCYYDKPGLWSLVPGLLSLAGGPRM